MVTGRLFHNDGPATEKARRQLLFSTNVCHYTIINSPFFTSQFSTLILLLQNNSQPNFVTSQLPQSAYNFTINAHFVTLQFFNNLFDNSLLSTLILSLHNFQCSSCYFTTFNTQLLSKLIFSLRNCQNLFVTSHFPMLILSLQYFQNSFCHITIMLSKHICHFTLYNTNLSLHNCQNSFVTSQFSCQQSFYHYTIIINSVLQLSTLNLPLHSCRHNVWLG